MLSVEKNCVVDDGGGRVVASGKFVVTKGVVRPFTNPVRSIKSHISTNGPVLEHTSWWPEGEVGEEVIFVQQDIEAGVQVLREGVSSGGACSRRVGGRWLFLLAYGNGLL